MAYDPVNQQVVLYGGLGGVTTTILYNDVWTWDGAAWTQRSPQPAFPGGRYYSPVMSYDPTGQQFLAVPGEILETASAPGTNSMAMVMMWGRLSADAAHGP
jgi:hypothetical protein